MSVLANRANLPDLERHLKLALVKFRGSGVSVTTVKRARLALPSGVELKAGTTQAAAKAH
jgi:hypothetical protein